MRNIHYVYIPVSNLNNVTLNAKLEQTRNIFSSKSPVALLTGSALVQTALGVHSFSSVWFSHHYILKAVLQLPPTVILDVCWPSWCLLSETRGNDVKATQQCAERASLHWKHAVNKWDCFDLTAVMCHCESFRMTLGLCYSVHFSSIVNFNWILSWLQNQRNFWIYDAAPFNVA